MAAQNIFQAYAQPLRSVSDFTAEMDGADLKREQLTGARRQNALAALVADQQRATMSEQMADRNALQSIAGGWNAETTPDARIAALRNSGRPALMQQADALEKQWIDRQKTTADVGKTGAETDAAKFKLQEDKRKAAVQAVAALNSPAEAIAHMQEQVQAGALSPTVAAALARMIQTDPKWQLRLVMGINDPKEMQAALMPHLQTVNTGGAQVHQAVDKLTGKAVETGRTAITQSADNAASQATAMRGQNMADARSRESNAAALSKPFEVTGADGAPVLVQQTKDGRIVPVQGYSPKAGNATKVTDAKEAIALLDQAEPLLKGSTGSTLGAAVDAVGQFFGAATPGSINAQQLKALEGALVAKMPKMSGPQSDKDVLLYRQMAAAIGDASIPYERKVAALQTVREIQERYAGMAPGSSKPQPVKSGTDLGDGFRVK